MANRNFKIKLRNASAGKITKDTGLITIGDDPADLPDDPPTLLDPENLNKWECVWDNTNNANVYQTSHTAEIGYEYILFFNAKNNDDQLSWARFYFGEEYATYPNHTYMGQGGLDYYMHYKSGIFFGSSNEYGNSKNIPIKALYRRPFSLIQDESLRLNPGEWEVIQKTEIKKSQFVWDFNYEYVFAVRQTRSHNRILYFWGYNSDHLMRKSQVDSKRPLLLANNRSDNKWIGFWNRNGSTTPSTTDRYLVEHNMSGLDDDYMIHKVYRRPTQLGNYPNRKPSDVSWHQVYSSTTMVDAAYFEWKEGKEYLMLAADRDGGDEGASLYFMLPENALTKYGIKTDDGYGTITGDHGWIHFQIKNGRKRAHGHNGGRFFDIYERDLTFDEISCADPGAGPITIGGEWANSQVAINAYEVSGGTGYRDNTYYIGTNLGIDAEGNLVRREGIISLIVVEDSTQSPDVGSTAYGVIELARFNTTGDNHSFDWSSSITFTPTDVPIKVNGSTVTSPFTKNTDLLKVEVEGLGITSQALFDIDLIIEDGNGNKETINGLQVLVNKTVAADGGSVYLRSDEIL